MAVNLKRLKGKKEEADAKRGGAEYYTVPVGETLMAITPPLPGDDLPFVETMVHYEVGDDNKMIVCLDEQRNPVLNDPRVQAILATRKKNIAEGCRVCRELDAGNEKAGRPAGGRYYFGVVPMKYRKSSAKKWREADDADELKILACGYTIWSGVTDVFINNGDISDPKAAILVRLVREGQGMKTKYTVSADADSIRAGGVQLSKPVRALISKQVQEGQAGDMYRLIGNTVRSSAEVDALVDGVPMEEKDEAEESGDKKPDCYGLDYEDGDKDCEDCDHLDACKLECKVPGDGEPEPEPAEDDTGEEEPVEDDTGEEVEAKDCTVGKWYTDDPDEVAPMKFTGTSKKGKSTWCFFEGDDGKVRLNGDDVVFACPEPTAGEDDEEPEPAGDDMAALDKAIDARKKAKKAKSKKASSKK
jgi:hypothetical protein